MTTEPKLYPGATRYHHQIIEEAPSRYRCTVCGQTFTRWQKTRTYCPATGRYGSFASVPANLKTVGQWAKLGKQPRKGEAAGAFVHIHAFKSQWANLWDESQVEPVRENEA